MNMKKKMIVGLMPLCLALIVMNGCSACNPSEEKKTPGAGNPSYAEMAAEGVDNLIRNFWVDAEGIRPTWGGLGIPDDIEDKRGQLWERAMMLFPMYHLWRLNGDAELHEKLLFEAARLKERYEESILTQAAHYYNTAADDCGWNAMLHMIFYDITKDPWYMDIACKLIESAEARWTDPDDGALHYKDGSKVKSLYTVGITSALLDIYDATGDSKWLDKALHHYKWMVALLLRSDNLYWTDADDNGPIGTITPNRIEEGSSVSFLAGNQAMCVIEKRLYDITKQEFYLDRIRKTSLAISMTYNNGNIYLNDRDAWTNGTFMCEFARRIASDPQLAMANADLLKATARSIVSRDVTEDGYYGGSWQGPVGTGSIWTDGGSTPQQIMTSGSTVQVLVAAAILDALD